MLFGLSSGFFFICSGEYLKNVCSVQMFLHFFCTRKNYRPRSPKVRSPGQVKWPHLMKSLNARQRYTDWTIALKLSAIDIHTSIYETYISEFWYRWPKVRSILRPLHYKSMGEKMKGTSFARKPFKTLSSIGLQVELTSWVGILWPVTPRHVFKVISGHESSPAVFRV